MNYLVYATEELAHNRTQEEAQTQGCYDHGSTSWFGCVSHPTSGECALIIPGGEEDKLTQVEIDALKTKEEMKALGWLPDPRAQP